MRNFNLIGMCLCVQVVRSLTASVGAMQAALPVLQALLNSAVKERHWTKLAAIMGTPVVTDPPLSLCQLLDLKVCFQGNSNGAGLIMHCTSLAAVLYFRSCMLMCPLHCSLLALAASVMQCCWSAYMLSSLWPNTC